MESRQTRIVFTTPYHELSGVNTFHANLIESLRRLGWGAELLITQTDAPWRTALPRKPGVPVGELLKGDEADWHSRWRRLVDLLENRAPCIYVPGYDFYYSCVSSILSDRVGILGVLHSDEDVHYDHAVRLGRYWNRIVCVSQHIAERMSRHCPGLADRLVTIPYGVPPGHCPPREIRPEEPIRIIYAGRLIQYQKRVLDLIDVTRELNARGVRYALTVVGDGPERDVLAEAWSDDIAAGRVIMTGTLSNAQTMEQFCRHDVIVLTSAFEGLPLSLLEAMEAGCVPVVSSTESGIPELIRDGETGFSIKRGRADMFVDALARLDSDRPRMQRMSRASHGAVANGPYLIETVAGVYSELFEAMSRQIAEGGFARRREPVKGPPYLPPVRTELSDPMPGTEGGRSLWRIERSLTFRRLMAYPVVSRMAARASRVYRAMVGPAAKRAQSDK